jgi:hypothetical protein
LILTYHNIKSSMHLRKLALSISRQKEADLFQPIDNICTPALECYFKTFGPINRTREVSFMKVTKLSTKMYDG